MRGIDRYILDEDGDIVAEPDLLRWADWFERHFPCNVARTVLPNGILVSTIFLAIDHSFGEGMPHLFETAVFLDRSYGHRLGQERYPHWPAAAAGHIKLAAEYAKRRPGD